MHDAVKRGLKFAHGQELKVMLDMTPEWWVRSFMDDHPEAAQWVICKAEGACRDGRFTVTAPRPDSREWQLVFEEVCAAYRFDPDGSPRRIAAEVEYEQFADKAGEGLFEFRKGKSHTVLQPQLDERRPVRDVVGFPVHASTGRQRVAKVRT